VKSAVPDCVNCLRFSEKKRRKQGHADNCGKGGKSRSGANLFMGSLRSVLPALIRVTQWFFRFEKRKQLKPSGHADCAELADYADKKQKNLGCRFELNLAPLFFIRAIGAVSKIRGARLFQLLTLV
jgi:hypothetical protein